MAVEEEEREKGDGEGGTGEEVEVKLLREAVWCKLIERKDEGERVKDGGGKGARRGASLL